MSLLLAGCLPEAPERASFVSTNRVLAVVAEPAEVAPGDPVEVRALVAGVDGTVVDPQAYYALCLSPKPPAENNAVNPVCWADAYVPVGGPGATQRVVVPEDACARFGPDTPPGGELRPRDADSTGGYFQPVRVAIPELAAFGFVRIRCALPDAAADVALAFKDAYQPNANPTLSVISAAVDGEVVDRAAIVRDAEVTFAVDWGPSAEMYLRYDRDALALVEEREAIRVSWFVTAGELAADATGRDPDDIETFTRVTWRAPADPGAVHLWAVARDSRGGVAFVELDVTVL